MNCTGKRCIMQFDKVDPSTCKCVSYCPQATPPKTHADKLRSMSDEELAKWLDLLVNRAKIYGENKVWLEDTPRYYTDWLDWLREEARDEAD